MDDNSKLLTSNELLCTLIGCIVGISMVSLPNAMVTGAGPDGWISSLIGGIYPIYVVIISSIIIKSHPNESIMVLYKKYLGSIIGNIFNFVFMAQFLLFLIGIISATIFMSIANGLYFLAPYKICFIIAILTVYCTSRGLKALSRINVITFFIILLLVLATALEAEKFNMLNIQPILGSGAQKIFTTSIESAFAYANMELLLVIHPFVSDKKNIIKVAFKASILVILLYTWVILSTTLFLGPDVPAKALWPFLLIYDSIKVQVLSNFKIVFIIAWIFVVFKTTSNEYFGAVEVLNSIIPIEKVKLCIYISPLMFFLPLFFKNELTRREFFSAVMPWVTIFNLSYVTIMAAIVLIDSWVSKKKLSKNQSGGTN